MLIKIIHSFLNTSVSILMYNTMNFGVLVHRVRWMCAYIYIYIYIYIYVCVCVCSYGAKVYLCGICQDEGGESNSLAHNQPEWLVGQHLGLNEATLNEHEATCKKN